MEVLMIRSMVSWIVLLPLAVASIIGTPAPVQAEVNGGCEIAASITAPTTVEVGQSFSVEFVVDDGCEENRNRVLVVLSMTGQVHEYPGAYVENQYREVLGKTLSALQDSSDATTAELAVVLHNGEPTFCTEGFEYLTEIDISKMLSCLDSNKNLTNPRQNYRSLLSWADEQISQPGWASTLILIDAGHSAPKPACPTTHRDFGKEHAFYMIGVSTVVDTVCFLNLVSKSGFPPGNAPMFQMYDARTTIQYENIREVLRQSGFIYNAHWKLGLPEGIDVIRHNFGSWNRDSREFEGWQAGISPFRGQNIELRIGETGVFELFDHAQLDWEGSKGDGTESMTPLIVEVIVSTTTTPTPPPSPTDPPSATPEPSATATAEPTEPPTPTDPDPTARSSHYTIHLPLLTRH